MKKFIFLPIYLSIYLSVSLNGQVINKQEIEEKTGIKRNTMYNLEEIKVRWKKAALENCPGVPCFSAPGNVSSIVATPTGPTSASVSFVPPTNDGGSPITGYTVTATPTGVAPAKRKSSGIITVTGKSSPISVTGLDFGVYYIFTVVATNAVGGSSGTTTITTITPCILNTATAATSNPTLTVNTDLTPITHNTSGAKGISTPTDLPEGVSASWSGNVITISGTPKKPGTYNYTIPLNGGCGSVNATGTITVTPPFICGTSTILDRDGNSYNTVSINQRCWTKENLKVTKYNNGDVIPDETSNGNWGGLTTGARTVYSVNGDTTGYVGTYGYLYNWFAATDSRKLCPTGWHVPTDGEWTSLIQFIDPDASSNVIGTQSTRAGGKLKSRAMNPATSYGWNPATPASPGTDNYDFSALPGGYRFIFGSGDNIRSNATFWSATESQYSSNGLSYILSSVDGSVNRVAYNNKPVGASVRCLRD